MLLNLTLLSLISIAQASCPPPNGIEKAMRFQECRPGADHTLKVLNITVTNPEGMQEYPVNVGKPFDINLVLANYGKTVRRMLSDAEIEIYTNILWFPCDWRSVPTFGLLSNMEACVGCPLEPGINRITMRIDPSQYGPIIWLLSSGSAYAVEAVARDGDDPERELACFRVEGIIAK